MRNILKYKDKNSVETTIQQELPELQVKIGETTVGEYEGVDENGVHIIRVEEPEPETSQKGLFDLIDEDPDDIWWLYKMRKDYDGYAIKARRDTNNETKDIGWSYLSDDLRLAKCDFKDVGLVPCATGWCGDNPGCSVYMDTIYNQIGTESFTQNTIDLQFKIPENYQNRVLSNNDGWQQIASPPDLYRIDNYLDGVGEIEIWSVVEIFADDQINTVFGCRSASPGWICRNNMWRIKEDSQNEITYDKKAGIFIHHYYWNGNTQEMSFNRYSSEYGAEETTIMTAPTGVLNGDAQLGCHSNNSWPMNNARQAGVFVKKGRFSNANRGYILEWLKDKYNIEEN
jgi:hypothetical protein